MPRRRDASGWKIVLKKSKIEQLKKYRESRFLNFSAAMSPFSATTEVHRRWTKQYGLYVASIRCSAGRRPSRGRVQSRRRCVRCIPKVPRDGIHDSLQFIRIAKHRDARHMRCNLIERLQPFASDRRLEIRETREVAARSAEVCDNAGALGIGDSDKYGWNRFRCLPHRGQDRCATRMTSCAATSSAAARVRKLSGSPAI
jgi:hypothetical protein